MTCEAGPIRERHAPVTVHPCCMVPAARRGLQLLTCERSADERRSASESSKSTSRTMCRLPAIAPNQAGCWLRCRHRLMLPISRGVQYLAIAQTT